MKKTSTVFSLLIMLAFHLSAQRSFGIVAVGLESGFDVAQFTDGMKARFSPSLQAEVSLWRFSFGAGIGKKYYPDYEYYVDNGQTVDREVNGATVRYFLADVRSFAPQHWIIPVKINFRIHRCDCVYLHAGVIFDKADFSKGETLKFSGAEFQQPVNVGLERTQLIKPTTRSLELGVGFNVFRRDFFRLTARPAYVMTRNPEEYTNAPAWLPTLRFSFGAQFALWRPIDD